MVRGRNIKNVVGQKSYEELKESNYSLGDKDVCNYKHVGNAFYDTECGIEGELILDDYCRKCGKKIKQEIDIK